MRTNYLFTAVFVFTAFIGLSQKQPLPQNIKDAKYNVYSSLDEFAEKEFDVEFEESIGTATVYLNRNCEHEGDFIELVKYKAPIMIGDAVSELKVDFLADDEALIYAKVEAPLGYDEHGNEHLIKFELIYDANKIEKIINITTDLGEREGMIIDRFQDNMKTIGQEFLKLYLDIWSNDQIRQYSPCG